MPHRDAGWRMDPPVSVPIAHGASPAATAAALPPDEPPGTRLRSHGFRTGPKPEFSFDEPIANSSMLVLPSTAAPAARRFATAVQVYGGRYPSRIRDAAMLGTPSTQKRSLTASGTPASGPSAFAAASGPSATHRKAFRSSAAARSRYASNSSPAAISPALIRSAACAAVSSSN